MLRVACILILVSVLLGLGAGSAPAFSSPAGQGQDLAQDRVVVFETFMRPG